MRPWIGYRAARVLRRFFADANYRNAALVRLAKPENLFQPDNYTLPNRYPHLFQLAAREIGDGPEKRILSFGCSTGEEVFALRAYFPSAVIKGIDINRHNVAICRRKLASNRDARIEFEVASSASREEAGAYDAIFCLAVFRNGTLADRSRERCDELIRFQDFDTVARGLARALRPGGIMFIEFSNFRFSDTDAYRDFETVSAARPEPPGDRSPIYDRHNRLIPGLAYDDVVFRKIGRN
jgi:SAM-dependent methyltransferase